MEARASEAPVSGAVKVIRPAAGWSLPDVRELWHHRDLVYYLSRRDIVVRYKQAVVGLFWAVLQPLLLACVFSLFLGQYAKVPSPPGVPYPLFVVSGLVIWLFFAGAVEKSARSTVESEGLISKIYFPRAIIPVSAVVPPVIDLLLAVVVLIVIGALYGFYPGLQILALPLCIGLALMTALGLGLWLSALNVKYRDAGLVVPFALLVGLFITPVMYPFDLVPENVQWLYSLNPMVGVLESFRWSMLGTDWPGALLLIPLATGIVLLVTGAIYFERAQRSFADVI